RFLDARGWHPFLCRVITPANEEETQPEILKLTRNGALPAELVPFTNPVRINDLLDGRIPSTDPQGEVYRLLVLAACRYYHHLMPFLFEALDDETELLLPDDLLTEHAVAQGFRSDITDDDCAEVEIIGWLYQFYIAEKKDEVMARKSAVPTEDIPAVTQLFTPHWIVRYLVENSLGRLWLLNRPGSALREHMPYYIEGEPETDFLKITKPEEIRLLDPATGSGHMLTYSFDLLHLIYEEEGHAPSEIPGLILRHNLFGLEICSRATQLAQFALVCKAREKSRLTFRTSIQPQVMCLEDVKITSEEMTDYLRLPGLRGNFSENVLQQVHQFREKTSTFGSLIQPRLNAAEIAILKSRLEMVDTGGDLLLRETHRKVIRAIDQAEMLSQRYHVVVTNPPYMGSKFFNPDLKHFINEAYAEGKSDAYGAFMFRLARLAVEKGYVGMITIPNWMFLSAFEDLRLWLIQNINISSLVHLGRGVWGSDFGSCAFVLHQTTYGKTKGYYKRLFRIQGEVNSPQELEKNFFDSSAFPSYQIASRSLSDIPGAPIAYWISDKMRSVYKNSTILGKHVRTAIGLNTGDNTRFLRLWSEVGVSQIEFNCPSIQECTKSGNKWFPYNKGGAFRKWYGNRDFIINWEDDGKEVKDFAVERNDGKHWSRYIQNLPFMFRKGVTWTFISSSCFGVRALDKGSLFDVAGSGGFSEAIDDRIILGFLCTKIAFEYLKALNPTLNFQAGNLSSLPFVESAIAARSDQVCRGVEELTAIAKTDWNNFETSWDFRDQPLLRPGLMGATLEASWRNWEVQSIAAIRRMQELETENNRLFIDAYGLQDELTPDVPEEQITLARADARRDIAAFLSYAVGCMMGRYSLDHPGLILADAGDTLEHYLRKIGKPFDQITFTPDADGIIPVLDREWFEDDIVARTRDFLRATFGVATLEENVRFIEESLGKDLHKYFLTDFYKDHLQTYKKRPIYWLFQSPKKGFSALIYLHRYTRDTVNVLLNGYLRDFLHKLHSRIEHLEHVQATSESAREKTAARKESDALKKTVHECEEYEREIILPLAQQRIELDLDDGVKANYLKFGKALAPIPGLAAKEEDG
ncbi:MAG: BREX-1 system adenine-specific DNA-methyltransferase PglX, partial [Desulfobacteraceae bacterium]|nr:BREX-1 system adenine-specific DNA-methyltransferase PglX [Desulfobacteraceae bacterium]